MTLLCPVDSHAASSHLSHTVAVPSRGLTRRALLEAIAAWYADPLALEEQMVVMRGTGLTAQLVRDAFIDGRPLARGQLLGCRCSFEGLLKAQRDGHGTIYELRLEA